MGDVLSGILGTNSQVGVNPNDALTNLSPWISQNQALASQLQGQAAGGGPNPAQLQLQQNAQQIAQAQAMQNAQNRAINPGLAARMAGQNAAQAGQQAAANSGIQQAQQQLGSQQLLSGLISQQQHNINSASAVNSGVAAGNQQAAQGIVGGIMGGVGSAMGLAKGGMVPHYDMGGPVLGANITPMAASPEFGPNLGASNFGVNQLQMPQIGESAYGNAQSSQMSGDKKKSGSNPMQINFGDPIAALARFNGMMASGGEVGGPKSFVGQHIKNMKAGGPVAGKAKVKGDSLKNDTVPAMLSPGEVVIPRHITESKDAPKKAAAFVAAVLAKKGQMR